MFTSLVVGATLAAPAAPVPKDTVPAPTGPAPHVVRVQADANGKVQLLVNKTQTVNQTVNQVVNENGKNVVKQVVREVPVVSTVVQELGGADVTYAAADGTALTADEVTKRAKDGLTLLVSADGKPVPKGWLRAVRPNTVVVQAAGLVAATAPVQTGQQAAATPAPRLVLLAADADGKVRLALNAPADPTGAADQVFIGGVNGKIVANGRVIVVQNGAQLQVEQVIGGAPAQGAVLPARPLEDLKFDAYDLEGKGVAREDALTRLKAGGLVLVAGDVRVPDAAFLKAFQGDLLVLVSQELSGPQYGRPGFVRPRPVPLPPIQVQPLPAPVPALPVKPVILPAQPAPAPIQVKPGVIQIKPAVIRGQAVPLPAPVPAPVELPARPEKE